MPYNIICFNNAYLLYNNIREYASLDLQELHIQASAVSIHVLSCRLYSMHTYSIYRSWFIISRVSNMNRRAEHINCFALRSLRQWNNLLYSAGQAYLDQLFLNIESFKICNLTFRSVI